MGLFCSTGFILAGYTGNWKKASMKQHGGGGGAGRSSHSNPQHSCGLFKPGREGWGNRFALGETEAGRVKEAKLPNSSASHSFCLLNLHRGTPAHPSCPYRLAANPFPAAKTPCPNS